MLSDGEKKLQATSGDLIHGLVRDAGQWTMRPGTSPQRLRRLRLPPLLVPEAEQQREPKGMGAAASSSSSLR
jgi:hypothetical protein